MTNTSDGVSMSDMPGLAIFFLIGQGFSWIMGIVTIWSSFVMRYDVSSNTVAKVINGADLGTKIIIGLMVVQFIIYLTMLVPAIKLYRPFPAMAQGYCGLSIIGFFLILTIAGIKLQDIIGLIWAVVWILYFWKSERIKFAYRRPHGTSATMLL